MQDSELVKVMEDGRIMSRLGMRAALREFNKLMKNAFIPDNRIGRRQGMKGSEITYAERKVRRKMYPLGGYRAMQRLDIGR